MVNGISTNGSTIKKLWSYFPVTANAPLQQNVQFFHETGVRHSEKLPPEGRQYTIVGITAEHNIQFPNVVSQKADMQRYLYETTTKFLITIGETEKLDCTLADLLAYDQWVKADGSIERVRRDTPGMRFAPDQSGTKDDNGMIIVRPGLRTIIQLVQNTFTTQDSATAITLPIPGIVANDEFFIKINLDTDAEAVAA